MDEKRLKEFEKMSNAQAQRQKKNYMMQQAVKVAMENPIFKQALRVDLIEQ